MDLVGLVTKRTNPFAVGFLTLYHAAAQGLDTTDGPWATVCETHGTICNHRTKRAALRHLSGAEWCEECMALRGANHA